MTPTRLGEPTTTVYLARWGDQQLLPWRSDAFAPWQQSSLSLRTALIGDTGSYPGLSIEMLEQCRESLPAKGKWGVLLPLVLQSNDCWLGHGINAKGEPARFHYSRVHGLSPAPDSTQVKDTTA